MGPFSARCSAWVLTWALVSGLFAPVAAYAYDEALELERLEDVPGDRSVADEGNSLETGSVSDKPKAPASKPPPPKAAQAKPAPPPPAPPPPPPAADSIADAPPPRAEPPTAEAAPLRSEPETTYDEFGEPKKKRRGGSEYSSPLWGALELQLGFPSYRFYKVEGNGLTYRNSFTQVRLAVEWIPFQSFGKIAVGTAIGYFGLDNLSLGTNVTVNLTGILFDGFVSYRFQYFPHQLVVPYVLGGIEFNWIKQTTSSTAARNTNFTAAPGYVLGAGIAFSLRALSRSDAVRMDYTYGINDTYLVVEFVTVAMFDEREPPSERETPQLQHDVFRAGFRFEF